MMNYYELLNVDRNASSNDIKQAYRSMAKKYHPDINKSPEASKIIVSLNDAKDTLLDPVKRKDYDALLDDMANSKQYSKNKEETYNSKKNEYKETYSETYVTRWQFFVNYIKFSTDKVSVKLFKTLLVGVSTLFCTIVKWIIIGVAYAIEMSGFLFEYLSVILAFLGVVALITLKNDNFLDLVSFIPSNVEVFCLCLILSFALIVVKLLVFKGSINLFVKFQHFQDKMLVAILMK